MRAAPSALDPATSSIGSGGLGLRAVLFGSLVWAVLAGGGCQLSEPYLIPRKSLELVTSLQPDMRPHAQVPAIREGDKAPVLIDYRALDLKDDELARVAAKPARFYRARAAARNPMIIVGGIILGMALPHFVLGLAVGLDKPEPAGDKRAITDIPGGVLALTLSGLHLAAGAILIGIAERNPRIEAASADLLYQYTGQARQPPAPPADATP